MTTPLEFLTAIGRECKSVSDKFADWKELFQTSSQKMEEKGIKPAMRKYILGCRETYKRKGTVCAVEFPKRQKKYLKRKNNSKISSLKKIGLA